MRHNTERDGDLCIIHTHDRKGVKPSEAEGLHCVVSVKCLVMREECGGGEW